MKSLSNLKRQAQRGFTLIELMIVVAIIGILAVIAVPQYQNYVKKTRFSEVVSIADGYKTAIGLCIQENAGDKTVCDAGVNGIPAAPAATASLAAGGTIVDGAISFTGTAAAGGYTFVLTPTVNAESVTWAQTGTCLAANFCK